MSVVVDSLNHYKPYKTHNADMLKRYRSENGDGVSTYSIGSRCQEDSDCPMGNLCVESSCYVKCEHKGNDCPFWHTCRDDLHPDESVCGPYTETLAKSSLPTPRINQPSVTVVEEPKKNVLDYLLSIFG
jgi:hypothetical protein